MAPTVAKAEPAKPDRHGTPYRTVLKQRAAAKQATTAAVETSTSAEDVARAVLGGQGSVVSAASAGAAVAFGTFNEPDKPLGLAAGAVIASGDVRSFDGPNTTNASDEFGLAGADFLSELAGSETTDAAVLQATFVPNSSAVAFDFLFGSEEYDEFVGQFNDVFALLVNGQNCARVPGTSVPVSVNAVNNGTNPGLYRSNADGALATQADGITAVIRCQAAVVAGQQNTFTLAIADARDYALNSWALVSPGTPGGNAPIVTPEQARGSGTGGAATNPTARQGDPVNSATGAFYTDAVDLSVPNYGGVPLSFGRAYNSDDAGVTSLGRGWRPAFSDRLELLEGGPVRYTAADGQQVIYVNTESGYVGPAGSRAELERTAEGFRLVRNDQVRLTFTEEGRLTSKVDRNGAGVTLTWTDGRPTRLTGSGDGFIDLGYDESGRLASATSDDGRRVTYTVTSTLTSVTKIDDSAVEYAYDGQGRLATIVDASGTTVVQNRFGLDGRIVEQINADSGVTTFAWDAETGTARTTDPAGGVRRDVYEQGVLVEQSDPLGATVRYGYDDDLNKTTVRDAAGHTWKAGYDARGNQTSLETPAGDVTRWTYTERNDPATKTDAKGRATTWSYDGAGNLLVTTLPDGTKTTYTRLAGRPTLPASLADESGRTTTWTYDARGNVTAEALPSGRTTHTYTPAGLVAATTEPRGNVSGANKALHTVTFSYDAAGRQTARTDGKGRKTTIAYDVRGNRTALTDPAKRTSRWSYDTSNRVTSVTAPNGAVTRYTYDALGRVVQTADGRGGVRTSDYDPVGRITKAVEPGGTTWTYRYDVLGRLVESKHPTGVIEKRRYDSTSRLTAIDRPGTSTDVAISYDQVGNPTGMTDLSGKTAWTYDRRDRIASISRPDGRYGYAYDGTGRVTKRTMPNASSASTTFDKRGLPLSTALTSNGKAVGSITYGHAAGGLLTSRKLPGGLAETRQYDERGLPTQILVKKGSSTVTDQRWQYDAVGNPTLARTATGTFQTYAYDSLDRLTKVCQSTSCAAGVKATTYTYDANGNRTKRTATGTKAIGYSYDSRNRMTSATQGTTKSTYTYDAAGRMIRNGADLYSWDNAGRLKTLTRSGRKATYTYDGLDNRTKVTLSGAGKPTATIQIGSDLNNPEPTVVRLTGVDPLGAWTGKGSQTFGHDAWGQPTTVSARTTTTATPVAATLLVDNLGSVVGARNVSGTAVQRSSYEPFGAVLATVRSGSPVRPALGFAGAVKDPLSGIQAGVRHYSPTHGRFLAPDPVLGSLEAPARSGYVYAADQPTVLGDTSGEFPHIAIAGAIGGVVGAAWGGVSYGIQVGTGQKDFSWGGLGASVAGGAVGGAVGAACTASTLGVGVVGCAAAGGAAGGAVSGVLGGLADGHSGGQLVQDTVVGTVWGGLTGALGGVASKFLPSVGAPKFNPGWFKPTTAGQVLKPGPYAQHMYYEAIRDGLIGLPGAVFDPNILLPKP